jgi:hypothetical protein
MAVAIRTTDFPEGVGPDTYDGVNAEMDVANNPPEGLIFHWAGNVEGKWTITDLNQRPFGPQPNALPDCARLR